MSVMLYPHEGLEVVDSIPFSQPIMDFEAQKEIIFKQLDFPDFSSNVGIVVVGDSGNLEILLILL